MHNTHTKHTRTNFELHNRNQNVYKHMTTTQINNNSHNKQTTITTNTLKQK